MLIFLRNKYQFRIEYQHYFVGKCGDDMNISHIIFLFPGHVSSDSHIIFIFGSCEFRLAYYIF